MSNVPPELRAITAYLKDKEHLKTQGLFVNSADSVMLEAMHQAPDGNPSGDGGPSAQGGRFAAVEKVRTALDKGQPVSHPHAKLAVQHHTYWLACTARNHITELGQLEILLHILQTHCSYVWMADIANDLGTMHGYVSIILCAYQVKVQPMSRAALLLLEL